MTTFCERSFNEDLYLESYLILVIQYQQESVHNNVYSRQRDLDSGKLTQVRGQVKEAQAICQITNVMQTFNF